MTTTMPGFAAESVSSKRHDQEIRSLSRPRSATVYLFANSRCIASSGPAGRSGSAMSAESLLTAAGRRF